MVVLRGADIVCVSSLDWDAHWTSKQQIMHRLAESNRILYVEEPVTMLAPLKVPARWRRWMAVAPRLRKAQAGLWVLTPPPMLPFGNMYPAINRANQAVLAGYIRWAERRIGLKAPLLWTYLPTSCALIDRLDAKAVVYHCVDEHSAFPGNVDPEVVRAYDDELTRRADLVITTARNLLLSREHLNPNIHHVLHGADVSHFGTALDPELTVPADIAAIPAPRLGVVGVHDERLDLDAIEAMARADASWQVVLVGPIQPGDVDESRLAALPNVHVLGGKPVAELPGYLKALDVALIPYKLNELTRNIFPLKLYEYLAAGLPVVAAALPELAPFADRVSLAAEPGDYPGLIREALASDSPEARAARSAFAAENSWDTRVEEISGLVEEMLARKGASS
jgi:glycosyltransferase involved in cell wall biosynthesis